VASPDQGHWPALRAGVERQSDQRPALSSNPVSVFFCRIHEVLTFLRDHPRLVHAILGIRPPGEKGARHGLPGSHGPGTPCWSQRIKISLAQVPIRLAAAFIDRLHRHETLFEKEEGANSPVAPSPLGPCGRLLAPIAGCSFRRCRRCTRRGR
jgi:hypothetical protein